VTGRVWLLTSPISGSPPWTHTTVVTTHRVMSLPRLEPVVLITSAPPGSPSLKRKSKEDPSDALSLFTPPKNGHFGHRRVAQRGRARYVCRSWSHRRAIFFFFCLTLNYCSIPSAQVEVLLPPLGSWKRRLLDREGIRRYAHYRYVCLTCALNIALLKSLHPPTPLGCAPCE